MDSLKHILYDFFISLGLSDSSASYLNMIALLIGLLIIVFIIDFIVRRVLLRIFSKLAERSKSNFDDLMVNNKVFRNVAHIIPLIVSIEYVPMVFSDFPYWENIIEKTLIVFGIILTLWVVRSFLNTLKDYFKTLPRLKDKPIDSYIQVFMIFAWVIGIFSAFAIITGIPFLNFITGLGAASAIVILVFRDTILGFVASIQVSINDMYVLEIGLLLKSMELMVM